jgi:hypothetical protein
MFGSQLQRRLSRRPQLAAGLQEAHPALQHYQPGPQVFLRLNGLLPGCRSRLLHVAQLQLQLRQQLRLLVAAAALLLHRRSWLGLVQLHLASVAGCRSNSTCGRACTDRLSLPLLWRQRVVLQPLLPLLRQRLLQRLRDSSCLPCNLPASPPGANTCGGMLLLLRLLLHIWREHGATCTSRL